MATGSDQDLINRRVYLSPGAYRKYRDTSLDLAELTALMTHASSIVGREILEMGVGTGRLTRYLLPLAHRYVGIDYAPGMVARARKELPEADVRVMDARDLEALDTSSFDCVLALCNMFDAVSHEDRLAILAESRRLLRPDGVLIFSSHNLRYRAAGAVPHLEVTANPLKQLRYLARYALRWRNHRRVRRHRRAEEEYALLNDAGHHFSLLHYYISRPVQSRQLDAAGFALVTALARDGRSLVDGDNDAGTPDILYVARRVR